MILDSKLTGIIFGKNCGITAVLLAFALGFGMSGCGPTAGVCVTVGRPGSIDAYYYRHEVEASGNPHSVNGVHFLKQKQWPDAEREFLLAIQDNPRDSNSVHGLGAAFARQARFEEAELQFEKAVQFAGGRNKKYNESLRRTREEHASGTRSQAVAY